VWQSVFVLGSCMCGVPLWVTSGDILGDIVGDTCSLGPCVIVWHFLTNGVSAPAPD
jgi:hypothetical protein